MKISNPLTIIAVFAGVAEAFATLALVNLPLAIQGVFVYFVMAFPAIIVVTFFLILVLKPHVLYAPSDYGNQEHFLLANQLKADVGREAEKIFLELSEANRPIDKNEVENLKRRMAESILGCISSGLSANINAFLRSRPSEAFSEKELEHIFSAGRRHIRESISELEHLNLIIAEVEEGSGQLLWQRKD